MGVDHRGTHIFVAQQLLHRPDVRTAFPDADLVSSGIASVNSSFLVVEWERTRLSLRKHLPPHTKECQQNYVRKYFECKNSVTDEVIGLVASQDEAVATAFARLLITVLATRIEVDLSAKYLGCQFLFPLSRLSVDLREETPHGRSSVGLLIFSRTHTISYSQKIAGDLV